MTQTIKQKNKGLPPELAAIKSPTNIHECLDIIYDLQDPQNYVDKYKLYLANQYFQDSILFLNIDQIERGLKNSYVQEKYDQLKILNQCIKQNIAFPKLFSCIISKHVPRDTLYKYCEVLSRHGKKEDLNTIYDYYQFDNNPLVELFKNSKTPSNALVEVMIQNDPQYILQAKTWTNEMVVNWINDNKEKCVDIISKSSGPVIKTLPLVIQHAFYNNLIEHFNNPAHAKNSDISKVEYHFLTNLPITYLEYLQDKHADYFNKKLHQKIKINSNNVYTMNICQSILFERKFNSIEEIDKVFSPYKDLMRKNISEQIGLFTHEVLAFEYAIKNDNLSFFVPFSINDELESKEREILLAVSFNCLVSHSNAKQKKLLNSWAYDIYSETLTHCTNKEFNKYAKALMQLENVAVEKELHNYALIRKVNDIPLNNGQQVNKLKI